jgi:gliding motility-associated-like protein
VASVSASPSTVCPGLSSVLTATGGGTYQWSTGETGATITVTPGATTTYSVTVTNNGCVDVEQVTVTVGAILTPTVTASPTTVCPGQSSVLTASGGDTYSWSTGQSGASITVSPITTTTYSVTATNNGCTGTATVPVNVDPSLTATATAGPMTICEGQSSTLSATGGGTYAWSTGQSGSPIMVSPSGTTTYTVTVTNNGCTGTADVTVNVTPPPSATATANPPTICAGQAGTLTATGGGTYLWSDGQIGASVTVMPSSTTSYTVTVTNNGCTATATVTVNVNPLPTPTASASPAVICAGQAGTLTATGGGTYQWNTGQTGATINVSPTSTTTYTVTVTNNGCTATADVTMTVNPLPTPTASASPAVICAGQAGTLTATGGGTYQWNTGQTGATINVSPTATTTYTVTVTNNGCTATTDVTVTVNPLPMPTASASPTTICAGQSSTLTATGGGTYQWNGGQFGSPIQVSPASTTTYTVTVTNNGCTGTADVTVTVNSTTATATASPAAICAGLASTLTATGGGTYAWSTGQSGASISVNPTVTTTYSVTVTNNGCTDEATVSVNVENNLSATATASPAAICAGQASTLTATGGGTYAWSSGQSGATITVSPVATTTYTVTVTNNGCTGTASVTVTVNPLPTPMAVASPAVICAGQAGTLTATGGGAYTWSTGQSGASITVSPTATTTYSVTATNNGCSGETQVTVTVNTTTATATAALSTVCPGLSTTLTATGGGTYAWSTGQSGATITVTPAATTTYTVTVTNNGCTDVASATVAVSNVLVPSIEASPASICTGQSTVLTAFGGDTFLWNTGQTDPSITVMPSVTTTYSVEVGLNGCTGSSSITVVVNPLPVPTASANPSSICAGQAATLTASGGDTFQWSTGESGSSISVTPAATTTYSVTATSNGCTGTTDVTVVVNPLPVAAAFAAPDSICAGQAGTLTATGGSTYMWSTGQSGSSIVVTPASTTTYTVTVTDSGCNATTDVTVTVNPLPTPTATANPGSLCAGQAGTLTATGGDTYLWSDGQSGASVEVTPTATTTYAVTVTSIYGCQAATSTTVTVNPLPTATASPETICLGQSAVLTAGGGTTYSWSTGQTGASITVSPTATTIYTVTVTANGCTDTTNVTVTVNEVNASVSASATTICPGLPVDLIASGGSVYSWSTGQAGETITVNPVVNTTYSVTVTNQGCTGLASVTVMMGDTLTPTIIATPDTLCAGQAGTLTAEGGGTYQWSSGQSSASIIVAPTSTTTYVVTVANSGCVGAAQTTIVVNPLPVPDVQTSAPVICDGDSATLSASGGSAYLWSTGDTDAVISVSPSQTTLYSVTVTENGCSATASTTLIVNPIPVALAQPDTICVGQSAALSASGGDVYQWSTGQSGASITVSPVVTTTYSVTVIDEGCTSVIPVTVTVNPLPEPVAVASPPIICFGQSTTLTVSGGATFVWSTGQSGATITVTPGNSATYGITVTENDCVGTTQIAVTVNTPPSAVVTLNADVCNGPGGPATLDFSALVIGGDQGGVWTDLQNSGATGTFPTLDFTGVAEGNYLFRYTTQSATAPCQEAIYDVTVQVVFCDCPSVATSAAGPLCNTGGSLNLNTLQQTSEPGTWSIVAAPSGSNPAIITNSIFNATNADAGLYEIRFTLVNTPPAGCPAFSTQFIQVDDAVFAGQPEPAVHFCVGSNDVVSLFDLLQGEDLGGQWTEISAVPSTSGAFQAAAGSFALSGQLPATYRFRYLLSTGGVCPASEAVVSIVIEPSPIANAGADMALDCIITSVTLNGANSSSGPHISYLWSTTDGNITAGINTATPSANAGGVYQLTVTNITYGCSATDEVTVTADNIPPQSAVVSIQNPRCHNETNGAVSVVSVSGGSGPFLYSFNAQPFVASPNFSSLGAGVYPLIVEDANGCRWETSIELENPPAISVDAGPNVTIFYGDSTRLDAEITPASGNYVIKWTPSDSLSCTSCPQPLAGPDSTVTYHVLVTDENGCTATDEVTVFIKFKPDVYIPNSFSPNGDNINDIFMIYAGDRIDKILELEIYSRWGESVFYVANFLPNDPQYGWDGMFRGKPAVLDVYAYFAIILYKDGKQKLFKGDMQVVK